MSEIPPVLLSAIICERVLFDKFSGMPSLINIVQAVNAREFPVRHGRLVLFCELTNGHGQTGVRVRLVDANQDDKVVFEQNGNVEFKDVKQIVSLTINMHGLGFPHPGEYRFQVFSEHHLLGERRIVARKVERNSGGQGTGEPGQQGG